MNNKKQKSFFTRKDERDVIMMDSKPVQSI